MRKWENSKNGRKKIRFESKKFTCEKGTFTKHCGIKEICKSSVSLIFNSYLNLSLIELIWNRNTKSTNSTGGTCLSRWNKKNT